MFPIFELLCKAIVGLTPSCKPNTGLPLKSVNYFQDGSFCVKVLCVKMKITRSGFTQEQKAI